MFEVDENLIRLGDGMLQSLRRELSNWMINTEDFIKDRVLGKGASGEVYLAHDSSGRKVAVKELLVEHLAGRKLILFCREVRVSSRCEHPFLVPLIGFSLGSPFKIVSQYMPKGTLYNLLHRGAGQLTATQRTVIAMGIASGMARLHDQGIIHRDLKSLNVLLDEQMFPRVCDFGISRFMDSEEEGPLTHRIGTPSWTAPEMFMPAAYTPKVDVYSYAIILFELVTDSLPHRGIKPNEIINSVVRLQERPPLPARTPPELRKLIQTCWSADPEARMSFSKIYDLFVTHKVAFEGTDQAEVNRVASWASKWRADALGSSREDVTQRKLVATFKSLEPARIIGIARLIDKGNFPLFVSTAFEVIRENATQDVVAGALFVLLFLISNDPFCLEFFAQNADWSNLPLPGSKLDNLSLSLLIPVLEKYPGRADSKMISFIQAQIPTHAMKTLRLLSIIIDSMTDKTLNLEVCDNLTRWADIFISQGAGRTLMNTLQKTLRRLPAFRAARFSDCLIVFVRALNGRSPGVIHTALGHLTTHRPSPLPVPPEVLVDLLGQEQFREKVLRLISVTVPETVSSPLLGWLVEQGKTPGTWENVALLNCCRSSTAAEILLKSPGVWLAQGGVLSLKIIMVLAVDPAKRAACVSLPGLPELLADLVKQDLIGVIGPFLLKCPLTLPFVNALIESGCVSSMVSVAKEANNEAAYSHVYTFIEALAGTTWTDDFAAFVDVAISHLKESSGIAATAVSYLAAISSSPSGAAILKQAGLANFLEQNQGGFPAGVEGFVVNKIINNMNRF
jgi:serine/threonine protein kinase